MIEKAISNIICRDIEMKRIFFPRWQLHIACCGNLICVKKEETERWPAACWKQALQPSQPRYDVAATQNLMELVKPVFTGRSAEAGLELTL